MALARPGIPPTPGSRSPAGPHPTRLPPARPSGGADADELFDRRDAGRELREAVVPHRPHALLDGGALDLLARRLGGGELLEPLAHREQLEDADAAPIARAATAGAPAGAPEA